MKLTTCLLFILVSMLSGFAIAEEAQVPNTVVSQCGAAEIDLVPGRCMSCYSSKGGGSTVTIEYWSSDIRLMRTCTGYYEVFDRENQLLNSCFSFGFNGDSQANCTYNGHL